ncbi:glycosyltransferase family 2 protein [Pedobacter sp. BS3]|uniref:glycosyltransferase family 2 protein n=1 Tax=Pedobacter sp. BS3 TaxID=2567937 RepID=UPI0016597586|nr:glycosyltransferase family A protein [Pedobacter sp. BS3]
MPVYNAEKYLKESIESILNQSYPDFEFIIINDGSTDDSLNIIQSYQEQDKRIKIINQSNQGISKALNNGISIAKGKYIARMDADDISMPHRLKVQIDFLNKTSKALAVGSNAMYIDVDGNYLYTSSSAVSWFAIQRELPQNPFFHSSVMFKKAAWSQVGGYREDIVHYFEDKILWNQFAQIGELHNIKEPLIYYRLNPESVSNNTTYTIKLLREIYDKVIRTGNLSQKQFYELKKITSVSKKKKLSNYYLLLGSIYLNQNFNKNLAIKNLLQGLYHTPINMSLWLRIGISILPKTTILFIRRLKNRMGIIINSLT